MEIQKAQHDSTHLSAERLEHRQWIAGRILTLLSHYWRDDDPVELTGAIGKDWADVLEGLPRDAIQAASLRYMRTEPRRRPTPGIIYAMTVEAMPKPRVVAQRPQEPIPEPERISRERAAEIMAEVGFAVKKMKGMEDE